MQNPHVTSSPDSFFGGRDVKDTGQEEAADEYGPPESCRGQGNGVACEGVPAESAVTVSLKAEFLTVLQQMCPSCEF